MPLVLLWGVLAFITNFIPNIGFIIGLVPPALVALLTGGWQLALAVVVVYCLLNMVIQSLIQPRFIGDSVGLSATVTFVVLLFWAWVLGLLDRGGEYPRVRAASVDPVRRRPRRLRLGAARPDEDPPSCPSNGVEFVNPARDSDKPPAWRCRWGVSAKRRPR